jgi:uncharacterized protein (TIGR00725 family)
MEQLLSSLPTDSLRVSIFGSVDFNHKDSPELCAAIGRRLATITPGVTLLTGANAVVHEHIAAGFCEADPKKGGSVFHLKPLSMTKPCNFMSGSVVLAGNTAEERRQLLAQSCHVAISIEGGPGTADEMRRASSAGRVLIPVSRTGGASAGMFDAPAAVPPPYVRPEDWMLLSDTAASPEETAAAVAAIVDIVRSRVLE